MLVWFGCVHPSVRGWSGVGAHRGAFSMRCMRYWCDAKLVDSAATYPARRFLARSACRSLIAPHRALANE